MTSSSKILSDVCSFLSFYHLIIVVVSKDLTCTMASRAISAGSSGGSLVEGSQDAPRHMTPLELRPSSGPTRGGTSITILHHHDFGESHDVRVGNVVLNCSVAEASASRCCCTPATTANITSLPLTPVHRTRGSQAPTSSGARAIFSYYQDPRLLWIRPPSGAAAAAAAASVPVTIATSGWPPSTSHNHAKCKFGAESAAVPATVVGRSESAKLRRPSGETWLRCDIPSSLMLPPRGSPTATVLVAPNGYDFGTDGLILHLPQPSSHAWLTPLIIACMGAFMLAHAWHLLRRTLDTSGWSDATPHHWRAGEWHHAMRAARGPRSPAAQRVRLCASEVVRGMGGRWRSKWLSPRHADHHPLYHQPLGAIMEETASNYSSEASPLGSSPPSQWGGSHA